MIIHIAVGTAVKSRRMISFYGDTENTIIIAKCVDCRLHYLFENKILNNRADFPSVE